MLTGTVARTRGVAAGTAAPTSGPSSRPFMTMRANGERSAEGTPADQDAPGAFRIRDGDPLSHSRAAPPPRYLGRLRPFWPPRQWRVAPFRARRAC